jgi:Lipocalin-like domain
LAELRSSLVGSWRLVSYETRRADGADGMTSRPFGDTPIGLFIFDPDGNYSVQLSNPADPESPVASWGTYDVDEEAVLFILEPTAGTAQLPSGTKTTRRVTVNGDGTATFRPPVNVVDGVEIQGYITWRKVSGPGQAS